jgi:CDP-2,3-bis-(O-geranylgeranyl)-sn-glycerol synthase
MAGELPNSFVKRQLGIAPGEAGSGRGAMAAQFLADRLDSGLGMLAAVSVAVPTPASTWALVLLFGPPIHWSFSVLMFRLGIKTRPA